jgi:hypothetical protein
MSTHVILFQENFREYLLQVAVNAVVGRLTAHPLYATIDTYSAPFSTIAG